MYYVSDVLFGYSCNALSGPYTYGWPAYTAFGGMCRRMSRQTGIQVESFAVIAHDYNIRAKQGKIVSFHQPAPSISTQKSRPIEGIVEECLIDIVFTLIMEVDKGDAHEISQCLLTGSVAGGYLTRCNGRMFAALPVTGEDIPHGHFLLDYPFETEDKLTEAIDTAADIYTYSEEKNKWLKKENNRCVVPVGYRAISEKFGAGEIKNARSNSNEFQFVESVCRLGQWHSTTEYNLHDAFMRHETQQNLYLIRRKEHDLKNSI